MTKSTPSRLPWLLGAFLLGAAATVGVLILLKPGEPLTEKTLRTAGERWRSRGLENYDLEVEVRGVQKGRHSIQVRGGRVVHMTTGGADAPAHVRKFWTVQGMFDFLAEELRHAAQPEKVYGVSDPSQIVLRAEFDSDLGFPRRFIRHVMGRSVGIEWEVRSFQKATP